MKREYQKPTLNKREQLSKVTAQDVQSGLFKPDNGGGLDPGDLD